MDSGEVLDDLKKTNEQLMSVKIKLETDLDLLNVNIRFSFLSCTIYNIHVFHVFRLTMMNKLSS